MPRIRDVVCLSHLRWDFVFQRPQHLLTRCARERRVFYVEPPLPGKGAPRLGLHDREGVRVAVPHLPDGMDELAAGELQRELLDELLREHGVRDFVLWYYTPMALDFSRHLAPALTVYDCMDELSAFAFAPPAMVLREAELLRRANLVFTGGRSLYEAKRGRHRSVHLFPSSVDVAHFARARRPSEEPPDQASIPRPRLGYVGVIDERMDYNLLAGLAEVRPDWQIVLVGPICKVDPAELPRAANLHYLGGKPYAELPAYVAGWDVALLPFALNEATRYISPTKTPEYLAAGKPVISTPIHDVVATYGNSGLARIAATGEELVAAVKEALTEGPAERLPAVDAFLANFSWDETWRRMWGLIEARLWDGEADAAASGG
jgi:glycosyltransferase involved in cell wall biosynthesis